MRSAKVGRFLIYVYREQGGQHHLPHCHVYWGENAASVSIGDEIFLLDTVARLQERTAIIAAVQAELTKIRQDWNTLNPGRSV